MKAITKNLICGGVLAAALPVCVMQGYQLTHSQSEELQRNLDAANASVAKAQAESRAVDKEIAELSAEVKHQEANLQDLESRIRQAEQEKQELENALR